MEFGAFGFNAHVGVLEQTQPPTHPAPPVLGHIQSRSTAGSEPRPDIPSSLMARLLWQLASCGCLTVLGQGPFVFQLWLFWIFVPQTLLCHHADSGATVFKAQFNEARGRFYVTLLERSLFLVCASWGQQYMLYIHH